MASWYASLVPATATQGLPASPLPMRTRHVWHGFVEGIGPGVEYGFRVYGPWQPDAGLRCNPNKLLLDPYARYVRGDEVPGTAPLPYVPGESQEMSNEDSAGAVPRGVIADETFDWGDDRAPRHNIESLDALAGDINSMIDSEAISDLWDRYDRGEQNAFSKRLYTPQGQRAFDEIRARYRGEREFKQTVDRYIEEFEKLLEDVSKDDRGQAVLRSYLTSETGKVYTMLAHASGRFE